MNIIEDLKNNEYGAAEAFWTAKRAGRLSAKQIAYGQSLIKANNATVVEAPATGDLSVYRIVADLNYEELVANHLTQADADAWLTAMQADYPNRTYIIR